MRLDHGLDDRETDAVAACASGKEGFEYSFAKVRRHARAVVADHDLRAAILRAPGQKLEIEVGGGRLQRIGRKIQYGGNQRWRIGANLKIGCLSANRQAHAA